jgi:6-phosphogluconolactonase/glucosamine-6-phosphate isomerase/deaminase
MTNAFDYSVKDGLDFSQVTIFNLDEYFAMAPTSPQSYHFFMHENLLNTSTAAIQIPSGEQRDAKRFSATAALQELIGASGRHRLSTAGHWPHRSTSVLTSRAARANRARAW